MAKRMGVSRTPVREALRELGVLGLVQARPHCGGLVVAAPFENVTSLLKTLETQCACLVAECAEARQKLAGISVDGPDWRKALWDAVSNEPMARLLGQYWRYLEPCLDRARHDANMARQVLASIERADCMQAREWMDHYLSKLFQRPLAE